MALIQLLDLRTSDGRNHMLWLLIAVVVILLLFGGVGYGYRDQWGGYYGGGVGLIGLILIILIVLFLLGVLT
jgi:flagellar basal body-associated protein FliL